MFFRYLRYGFWLDLASSIPFNLFWWIANGAPAAGRGGDVIRFLPCLRIYRLSETFHLMSRLAKETFWSYLMLRIAKLTLVSSSYLLDVASMLFSSFAPFLRRQLSPCCCKRCMLLVV